MRHSNTSRPEDTDKNLTSRILLIAVTAWCVLVLMYLIRYWTLLELNGLSTIVTTAVITIILVISIVANFSNKNFRQNVSLSLFSIFFALYAFGVTHHYLNYYPGFPDLSPPLKITSSDRDSGDLNDIWIDKRSKLEVLRDLRLRGINAFPAFLVTNRITWDQNVEHFRTEPLPLGSISNSTVVHCNESGKWSIYESDEKGFNNPTHVWNSSSYSTILLGDSFVHGACVDPGEDLGTVIREEFPHTINLGQRGNGPLLQLAGLREYGRQLKPKFVLWFYTEVNDLDNLVKEFNTPFLMQYLDPTFSQNLINRQVEIDKFVNKFTEYNYKLAKKAASPSLLTDTRYILTLRSLRKQLGFEVSGYHSESSEWKVLTGLKLLATGGPSNLDPKTVADLLDVDKEERLFKRWQSQLANYKTVLRAAKEETNSWGGKLVFIFLPSGNRYITPDDLRFTLREPVLDIVNSLNITLVDAHPVFDQPNHRSLFPKGGGHYNAKGYKAVGNLVSSFMKGQ